MRLGFGVREELVHVASRIVRYADGFEASVGKEGLERLPRSLALRDVARVARVDAARARPVDEHQVDVVGPKVRQRLLHRCRALVALVVWSLIGKISRSTF